MSASISAVTYADLEAGYDLFEAGDVDAAVREWQAAAAVGNATAQLNLGQLYRQGRGVERDLQEAIRWYSMAANNGSEIARYNLLVMFDEGLLSDNQYTSVFGPMPIGPTSEPAAPVEAQPATSFLVQVVAASSLSGVKAYAREHADALGPGIKILTTERDGKPWHILGLGPFSEDDARATLAELPGQIRALGAWVRPASDLLEPQ
ncbi:MAG: SPOR domain-containing protein [Pseudomonadota bacterium]